MRTFSFLFLCMNSFTKSLTEDSDARSTCHYTAKLGSSQVNTDKVSNSIALAFVSRNDLTLHSCQLRFLGHLLRSDRALYALYEPAHGKTGCGCPRTNCINYIQKVTGHQLPEPTELSQNQEDWCQLVVECADSQPPDKREKVHQTSSGPICRGVGGSTLPMFFDPRVSVDLSSLGRF